MKQLLTRRASLPLTAVLAAAAIFGGGQAIPVHAATSAVNWEQQAPVQSPSARTFAAASYDSNRDRVVVFGGGANGGADLNDTWEWDGSTWINRAPAISPPMLAAAAMAYDSARGRSVLFGGSTPTALSSDTWEWDGNTWTKRDLAISPPPMVWAAMVYDSARGRMVLFGAFNSFGLWLSETWEFDGSAWKQANPANYPSARAGAAMAFDSNRNRVVIFGGRDANAGGRLADTWEWDGTNWTQKAPIVSPYGRLWHSMAFDTQRNRIILFGGDHFQPYDLSDSNDTWEWDGSQWTRDWTAAAPSVRAGQSMVYDSAIGRMVLFGGYNAGVSPNTYSNDTWELGSGIVTPPGTPAASISASSLDFGSVDEGTTSAAAHAFLLSSGTGPLLTTMSITGDFGVSSTDCPNAPDPLAAGSTCLIFVTFSPTMVGDRVGNLTLTGNVPGGSQSIPLHGFGLESDFSISANPTTINMLLGGPNPTSSITTTAIGAAGTVALSALTTDPGVTATFSPSSITAGTGSTMTIALAPSVPPGFYGVTVVGTEGAVTHRVDVSIHMIAIPDFSIATDPTSLGVVQGSSTTGVVTTDAVGPVGNVDLSASVLPVGPTAVLSASTIVAGGVSALTVTAGYGVAPGSYTVTVSGTEGSIVHSTSVNVTVTLKRIVNGGFETGDLTGWDQTGVAATIPLPHSGTFAGQVGSSSASATSTLAQTFTVPASGGKLTFWYRTFCSDKVKNDWFTATLQDGVTGAVSTLQSPVCSKAGGWTKVTANVSSHAGHFVTVTFLNHDGGLPSTPTFTVVDDVALT
jgi:hypothetical protein